MKYLQINLENYGGYDVEFQLSNIEFNARVKNDAILHDMDYENFEKCFRKSFFYVQDNIKFFPSIDFCEGPDWDSFREAFVDTICKVNAITDEMKHMELAD